MGQSFDFAGFSRQCQDDSAWYVSDTTGGLAHLYQRCESHLDEFHPERDHYLDCRPGCGDCCIVNVAVLWPEALAIVSHLEELPSDEQSRLLENISELWIRIQGVSDEDRVCMRQPCAFLDTDGSCSIYPARPLMCRSVTSTDAEACRGSFNAYLFNEERSVEMNLFQREIYESAFLGLSRGLEEGGMDGRSFELTGLIRYMLRHPDQRTEFRKGLHIAWDDML